MKPNSQRNELHNNYINGLFKMNIEDESKFDNTNNTLINNNRDFLLNKKIVKVPQNQNLIKNNTFQEDISKKRNEWKRNFLKITTNMQKRKVIFFYNLKMFQKII